MMKTIRALWSDEDGVTTVEYALLLGVLITSGAFVWVALRGSMSGAVDLANSELGNS